LTIFGALFPWVSSANSEFNVDLGRADTRGPTADRRPQCQRERHRRSWVPDPSQGFSSFALENATVYHTYSTGARGVEFLMGSYGILDRTPKGRDEGDAFQLWIRWHDEY
jgi:predicted dithiol-disulfide oxidoreductase (DUF899 family)